MVRRLILPLNLRRSGGEKVNVQRTLEMRKDVVWTVLAASSIRSKRRLGDATVHVIVRVRW